MVREVEKILFVEAFEASHYPSCLVGEDQCRNGIECVVRRDVKFVVQGDLKGQVVKVHEFGGVVWTALATRSGWKEAAFKTVDVRFADVRFTVTCCFGYARELGHGSESVALPSNSGIQHV